MASVTFRLGTTPGGRPIVNAEFDRLGRDMPRKPVTTGRDMLEVRIGVPGFVPRGTERVRGVSRAENRSDST